MIMADFFEWNGVNLWVASARRLFQGVCDDVFGKDAIHIGRGGTNFVLMHYKFVDRFEVFKENFKARLIRLKEKMDGSLYYPELLKTVKQVANYENGELAYAKLAAWDVTWDHMNYDTVRLDTIGVGVIADCVGEKMCAITEEAIGQSGQQSKCEVVVRYPWDDNEADYCGQTRKMLQKELTDYLKEHNTETDTITYLDSKVNGWVKYMIMWGKYADTTDYDPWFYKYNPYKLSDMTEHLVYKRFADQIAHEGMNVAVLVKLPWRCSKNRYFQDAEYTYFRSLARRTFCEYQHRQTMMIDIVRGYDGIETIGEVSKMLGGIVVVDENMEESNYVCHSFCNPNYTECDEEMEDFLQSIVTAGGERCMYDDFLYDNY